MKKRYLALFLGGVLLLPTLASCGDSKETEKASVSASQTESKSEMVSETVTESESEKETEPVLEKEYYEPAPGEVVLYVDPEEGSVDGDGSDEDPFLTIDGAYAAAVETINGKIAKNVIIYLRRGTYRIEKEIAIDGSAIKESDYSIRFLGYENVKYGAKITSTFDIAYEDFYETDEDDILVYYLPEELRDGEGLFPATRDLYMNGKSMKLATSEKGGIMLFDSAKNIKTAYADQGVSKNNRLLYVRGDLLGDLATDKNGYIIRTDESGNIEYDDRLNPIRTTVEYWVKTEWQIHCVHIERILDPSSFEDPTTKGMLIPVQVTQYDWQTFSGGYWDTLANRPYYFTNSLNYLDETGEFYYDRDSGAIYIYAYYGKNVDDYVVSLPLTERIFYLQNAKNISFENLEMWGVTVNYITTEGYITGQCGSPKRGTGFLPYGAIYGNNVNNVEVKGCYIHDVGDDALNFRGAVDNVRIIDNTVDNCGGSAVRFGNDNSYYSTSSHNCDIVVDNNYITNIGTVFPSNVALYFSSSRNLTVTHNTIMHVNYTAISVGYAWNASYSDADTFVNAKNVVIAYNYIEDFMTGMSDGGAIYTLGGNASMTNDKILNKVEGNYIVITKRAGNYDTGSWTPIYHDGSSSHWEDTKNVIVRAMDAGTKKVSSFTYITYQTVSSQQAYRCYGHDNYIIGYSIDDEIFYPTGFNGKSKKSNESVTFVQEEDKDTYTYHNADLSDANHVVIEGVYFTEDFDDVSDTRMAEMEEIYDECGSTLYEKGTEFGVRPEHSDITAD